jgi:hypothetical protein
MQIAVYTLKAPRSETSSYSYKQNKSIKGKQEITRIYMPKGELCIKKPWIAQVKKQSKNLPLP